MISRTVLCPEVKMINGVLDIESQPEVQAFIKQQPDAKVHTYYGMDSFSGQNGVKTGHVHVVMEYPGEEEEIEPTDEELEALN